VGVIGIKKSIGMILDAKALTSGEEIWARHLKIVATVERR